MEGFCDIVYTVTNFDGLDTSKYTTEFSWQTVRRANCAKNIISVTAAVPNTEVTSSPTSITINLDIGTV